MKTLNYQSLVCLGVIKEDSSIISQIQKERQDIKTAFLKEFVQLEWEIAALEDKKRIQTENNLSLFDYGTTYLSEKSKIESKISQTKAVHVSIIKLFDNSYRLFRLTTSF